MIDPNPRIQLCLMVKQYGQVIINEPKRCKGFLSDLMPQNHLEINLLMMALEQKIPDDLLNLSTLIAIEIQINNLAQRLREATGVQEELAYWAVESWALALDVIPQPISKLTILPNSTLEPFKTPVIERARPTRQKLPPIWLIASLIIGILAVSINLSHNNNSSTLPPANNKPAVTTVNKPDYLPLPERRDAWTENNIGDTYYYGHNGNVQNYQAAAHWYRRAAEQGDAVGQCNLGFMYSNGYGVPKDYQQAAYWYRKAADQGNADGQNNLGILYENGNGVPKDLQQAKEWYRKAVEQGHYGAQQTLKTLLK